MAVSREITGKRALVTGASAGLGREMARQLASMGADIVAVSRNRERLEEVKRDIESAFQVRVTVLPYDLSRVGAAKDLHSTCVSSSLDIDILVNNAALGMMGASSEQERNKIEGLLVLNSLSPTTLSDLFAADMTSRGGGYILNIGSLAGLQPTPFFASYAASKAYMFNYTVALHYELKKADVSVTCFLPGYIKTEFDSNAGIQDKRYLAIAAGNALSAERTAELALNALFKRRVYKIAGIRNGILMSIAGLIPVRLKGKLIAAFVYRYV